MMGQPLNIRALVAAQAGAYGCTLTELRNLQRHCQQVARNFAGVGDRAHARMWQSAADDMAERIAARSEKQPPQLFPRDLDDLLYERKFATDAAARIDRNDLATRELAWAFRLNDRIAKAVQE